MRRNRRQVGLGLISLAAAAIASRAGAEDIEDLPNVFISPCGEPFRAKPGAPYPVVDWFRKADTDKDGKLSHDEFVADAAAFFKRLDLNSDGFLSPYEVAVYEHRVCPEVLGLQVDISWWEGEPAARLWLVQGMPGGEEVAPPIPEAAPKPPDDAATLGAAPYGFFNEPEPVTAADLNFTGIISKANFLKLAGVHFTTLDAAGIGYLTLDGLPKTPVQIRIGHAHRAKH